MEKLELKKKKIKTHNLRKVLPLYAKNKGLFSVQLIFMLSAGILSILLPIFSANALAYLATGNFELAIRNAIIMCVIGIVQTALNGIEEMLYVKMNLRIKFLLTGMVIDAINHTKMKKLDSTQLGVLAERMGSDVSSISDSYLDMMDLVFSILTNVVFLFYIAYLNVYLFLILLGYVVVLYIVCTIKSRVWIRGRKLVKKKNEIARSAYFEQITAIRDVKLLNIKDNVTNYSSEKLAEAHRTEQSVSNKRNAIRRIQSFLMICFELVFLIVGIIFVKKEMLYIAGFLVIFTYYGRVESLIGFLSSFKEYKAEGETSATRVFEIIEDYEKEEFGTGELENFSGRIEFKNVNFSYFENQPVLNDLNLVFEPGKMTAIVGKSGSGKTTILSLISKLYDIDSGEILFDGKNINSLTEGSIHSNVGEISQSPYIFNSSIRQNLLFVKPDATDEELEDALAKAQILKDVKKMDNGIDTEIGENGVKLSGGQKQRVAIARLLLSKSKVIVFDEATSSLDNTSQNKIVDMLEKYKKDKTIIIVAHRLSTIVNADKIFMLEGGSVTKSGTHRELMQTSESYRELYLTEETSSDDENKIINSLENQQISKKKKSAIKKK